MTINAILLLGAYAVTFGAIVAAPGISWAILVPIAVFGTTLTLIVGFTSFLGYGIAVVIVFSAVAAAVTRTMMILARSRGAQPWVAAVIATAVFLALPLIYATTIA